MWKFNVLIVVDVILNCYIYLYLVFEKNYLVYLLIYVLVILFLFILEVLSDYFMFFVIYFMKNKDGIVWFIVISI